MTQAWMIPLAVLIGVVGTRTASKSRHSMSATTKAQGWWLLVVLAWTPLVCWFLSQFVNQD
jgi:hypothetical protein